MQNLVFPMHFRDIMLLQLCILFTSSKTIPRSLYSIRAMFMMLMIARNHVFEKYFLKTGF